MITRKSCFKGESISQRRSPACWHDSKSQSELAGAICFRCEDHATLCRCTGYIDLRSGASRDHVQDRRFGKAHGRGHQRTYPACGSTKRSLRVSFLRAVAAVRVPFLLTWMREMESL